MRIKLRASFLFLYIFFKFSRLRRWFLRYFQLFLFFCSSRVSSLSADEGLGLDQQEHFCQPVFFFLSILHALTTYLFFFNFAMLKAVSRDTEVVSAYGKGDYYILAIFIAFLAFVLLFIQNTFIIIFESIFTLFLLLRLVFVFVIFSSKNH